MPEYDSTLQFRPVVGFSAYQVDNQGNIWSCWRKASRGRHKGTKSVVGTTWRQLKPGLKPNGRLHVTLCPPRISREVHRIVLEAFVGSCPPGMECRHFPDPDPTNNRLENLQWGTVKQNQADRIIHGTDCRGEKNYNARFTEEQIKKIRRLYAAGVTQVQLGKMYDVKQGYISNIISRKTWKHVP